ncbi:beta-1,6-galactofuranosyltransferase [Lactococcus lactis]|uniref:Nucleotide sugar synthetase-like protein n=1 Tax=Lactococcus lactis subsp. lactis TaxID=1360 RepID=A0A0V8DVW7_LACLL|nr:MULTISPECIES: beta-1,6-galactofuranosyltransferase [Lactococcus]KSU17519.1 Nucleotide sugar synthetase-like protein [Lactococcus lactis subsp. lactis]MBK0084504.1 beta-1,6-galactofuranosyltransferase [Lactococcus sp. S64]MBK5077422.1 beta-1,6-galactofuranosyltransferase [Lactococcus lactis]MDG4967460.1 beta-1,6-galactofuranosyltransferase [Lactococcus lactis]
MTNWITEVQDNDYVSKRASGIIANQMAANSIEDAGFRKLHYPRIYSTKLREIGKEARWEYLEALLSCVLPGDTVIVQYPLWTNNTEFELEFINYLKNVRHAKIVAMVWDIVSWLQDNRDRDYTGDASLWMLNKYDLVIAANTKMGKRLREEGGVITPMIPMHLTDFIYKGPLIPKQYKKELYYVATGIDPAMIEETPSDIRINFIGPNHQVKETPETVSLLGPMDSNDIPSKLDGGFGLLYYPQNGGYKGMHRYGEYNNPMKLSLYLASGLPVICLSNTAHAKWIKEQRVGIVIDQLGDLEKAIESISEEDYYKMLNNLKPWQRAVSSGFFAKTAAIEAVRYINLGFTDYLIHQEDTHD